MIKSYSKVNSSSVVAEFTDDHSSVGDLSSVDDSYHEQEETLTHGQGEHRLDDGGVVELTKAVKIYTLCASLNSCIVGYDQGISTHISRLIQHEFGLTEWERGLYVAFLFLFMMWGALASPFISDRVGRRAALSCSSYVYLAGALLMTSVGSFYGLLIGRAICGFGAGLGFLVDCSYIAEIAPAAHRGELVTWSYIAATNGLMLGVSAGFVFGFLEEETRWRVMLGLGLVFPIASITACIKVLVETPRYLVSVKRGKEARLVLDMIYPIGKRIDPCSSLRATEFQADTVLFRYQTRVQCQRCTRRYSKCTTAGENGAGNQLLVHLASTVSSISTYAVSWLGPCLCPRSCRRGCYPVVHIRRNGRVGS